ncbi:MAG: hypothetical protein KKG78_02330 [Alphaproteobacteria bacterium]|nr:hypothetical protein [Alphaproteobacteria bacterium]
MAWTSRDLTVARAAQIVGLSRAHLDVIISRNKNLEILFSEKRKGRRWFSVRDIAVLRIAFELENAGRNWLSAIATAFDNLQEPPAADALLIAPAVRKRACGLPYIADRPPDVFERSEVIIPIGRIVAEIIKEADNVAIH